MNLEIFTTKYSLRSPQKSSTESQVQPVDEKCSVRTLIAPPAVVEQTASIGDLTFAAKNLWVFLRDKIPYAPEFPGLPCSLSQLKHTNLTGGDNAYCGGELWVDSVDQSHLILNGCSGRFGPATPQELVDAGSVFVELGFKVTNFGWDFETHKPARKLRT